jgi:hypothetical protein
LPLGATELAWTRRPGSCRPSTPVPLGVGHPRSRPDVVIGARDSNALSLDIMVHPAHLQRRACRNADRCAAIGLGRRCFCGVFRAVADLKSKSVEWFRRGLGHDLREAHALCAVAFTIVEKDPRVTTGRAAITGFVNRCAEDMIHLGAYTPFSGGAGGRHLRRWLRIRVAPTRSPPGRRPPTATPSGWTPVGPGQRKGSSLTRGEH